MFDDWVAVEVSRLVDVSRDSRGRLVKMHETYPRIYNCLLEMIRTHGANGKLATNWFVRCEIEGDWTNLAKVKELRRLFLSYLNLCVSESGNKMHRWIVADADGCCLVSHANRYMKLFSGTIKLDAIADEAPLLQGGRFIFSTAGLGSWTRYGRRIIDSVQWALDDKLSKVARVADEGCSASRFSEWWLVLSNAVSFPFAEEIAEANIEIVCRNQPRFSWVILMTDADRAKAVRGSSPTNYHL